MSTYSLSVSGPSTRLAMLRALATKLLTHLDHAWNTMKVTVSRAARVARTTATTALAVIGSRAGYQLVRHTTATTLIAVGRATHAILNLCGRGLKAAGRVVLAGIDLVSPAAADLVAEATETWLLQPLAAVTRRAGAWVQDAAQLLWELSGTPLVQSVTTRAAQVASIVLGVHTLTKGAVAAKIVSALPWTMDAVIVITNPGRALLGVGVAFLTAVVFAASRILRGPDGDA